MPRFPIAEPEIAALAALVAVREDAVESDCRNCPFSNCRQHEALHSEDPVHRRFGHDLAHEASNVLSEEVRSHMRWQDSTLEEAEIRSLWGTRPLCATATTRFAAGSRPVPAAGSGPGSKHATQRMG